MRLQEMISQLNEVYEGNPWYGHSISTYLQEIDEQMMDYRAGNSHSIGQIVAHMIIWRKFVIEKLNGVEANIEVGGPSDWPNDSYGPDDKNLLYSELKATQKTLVNLLTKYDDSLLDETVPGNNYTFEKLLTGIIQHDIYHLGQVYLLKSCNL